jgi:hypothetical protein
VDYSKEYSFRWDAGFDFANGEKFQISGNRKIRNSLYAFYPNGWVLINRMKIPATGDIMKYHKFLPNADT